MQPLTAVVSSSSSSSLRLWIRLSQTLCFPVAQQLQSSAASGQHQLLAVSSPTTPHTLPVQSGRRRKSGRGEWHCRLHNKKEGQVTFSSTDNMLTLPISPLDQHDQALFQASFLGRAPGLAGDRLRRQKHGPGASHLPHPHLHQTHHLPVLPPAAQRDLQTGTAVLRWDGRRTACWSGVKAFEFHQQKCMI